MMFASVCIAITALHAAIVVWCRQRWMALPSFDTGAAPTPLQVSFSILIPARNEENNIEPCLSGLLLQTLPPQEVLVIDDHSTDETARRVEAFSKKNPQLNIRLLRLPQGKEGKKTAIDWGVQHANGTYIICTDADCVAQAPWLELLLGFARATGAIAVTAPVAFYEGDSVLSKFQALDLTGMMGVTGAVPALGMGNGANLLYEKAAFAEVGGFAGYEGIASGDDMFLIQKLQRVYPGRVRFLKNPQSTVYTHAAPTWRAFVRQRIRWGGKSRHFPNARTTAVLGLVWLSCSLLLLNLLLGIFVSTSFLLIFGTQFFVKTIADYFFLSEMARFFSKKGKMSPLDFGLSSFIHPTYIAIVGVLANLVKKNDWKGRRG